MRGEEQSCFHTEVRARRLRKESYEVMLDPPEDGSVKKQSAQNPGRPPKVFLLVAGGGGAAAAAVILYEKHKHKDVESPDHS